MGLRILAALLLVLPVAATQPHHLPQGGPPLWDLQGALADSPPGAYFQLIRPVTAAISLGYCHADPEQKPCNLPSTITANLSGGASWERLTAFEQNSQDGGVANLVFVDRSAKRAIIAFKGSCMDHKFKRCRADMCFLVNERSFGPATKLAYGNDTANRCWEFSQAQLDYVSQARNLTKSLQDNLGPDYAVLLVGHSMGGLLSMMVAMKQPQSLQAVTFAPSPFHTAALHKLQLTEKQLRTLPGVGNRVALGDVFDLLPNTMMVPLAREGSLSCVFDTWDAIEPVPCHVFQGIHPSKLFAAPAVARRCKAAAHNWHRYQNLTLMRHSDGVSPQWLPNCSKRFSTLTPNLVKKAIS